jgi:ESCRT-II complex subunit VPS25
MSAAAFQFPEFYSFPPFFTLQPVKATRAKQLNLWRDLILNWHKYHVEYIMTTANVPLFCNAEIERTLSPEGQRAVIELLLESGHGEWEDATRQSRLRIMWNLPVRCCDSLMLARLLLLFFPNI